MIAFKLSSSKPCISNADIPWTIEAKNKAFSWALCFFKSLIDICSLPAKSKPKKFVTCSIVLNLTSSFFKSLFIVLTLTPLSLARFSTVILIYSFLAMIWFIKPKRFITVPLELLCHKSKKVLLSIKDLDQHGIIKSAMCKTCIS